MMVTTTTIIPTSKQLGTTTFKSVDVDCTSLTSTCVKNASIWEFIYVDWKHACVHQSTSKWHPFWSQAFTMLVTTVELYVNKCTIVCRFSYNSCLREYNFIPLTCHMRFTRYPRNVTTYHSLNDHYTYLWQCGQSCSVTHDRIGVCSIRTSSTVSGIYFILHSWTVLRDWVPSECKLSIVIRWSDIAWRWKGS